MSDDLITALSIARQFVPNGTEAAERVDTAMRTALEAQIAAVAPAVDAQPVAIQAGDDVTVTNVPARIYLNLGDLYEMGEIPFQQLTDVTWCEDKIDDTDIEYVRADASAQSEGLRKDAWQLIETAPKDGTEVLLIATRHSMLMPHPERIVGAYRNGWWSGPSTLSHVTHWMPLPEAPAALSQQDPQ